jgi:hypothetical protein
MTGEQLRQYLTNISDLADNAIALGHAQEELRQDHAIILDGQTSTLANSISIKAMQDAITERKSQLRCDALEDVQDRLRVALQQLVKNAVAINEHIAVIRTIEIK